jgi:hypothetical protein
MTTWVLADSEREYSSGAMRRPPADPLGMRGLPAERMWLDALAAEMSRRVESMGGRPLTGRRLATELAEYAAGTAGMPPCCLDTRSVRLLTRYVHVHLGDARVVGIPGSGYYWGPAAPGVVARAIADSRRRGRSAFYRASILHGSGTPAALAQLVFDFMGAGQAGDRQIDDELAALVAVQGVTMADAMSAMVERMAGTDAGRRALAEIGRRHADVLVPAEALTAIQASLEAALTAVRAARPTSPPPRAA